MSVLIFLIPIALLLGLIWLVAFIWSIRSGQYDDLEGASLRILMDEDAPLSDQPKKDLKISDKKPS